MGPPQGDILRLPQDVISERLRSEDVGRTRPEDVGRGLLLALHRGLYSGTSSYGIP